MKYFIQNVSEKLNVQRILCSEYREFLCAKSLYIEVSINNFVHNWHFTVTNMEKICKQLFERAYVCSTFIFRLNLE